LWVATGRTNVQHADVKLLTILERVDPKTLGVEELPALAHAPGDATMRAVNRSWRRPAVYALFARKDICDERKRHRRYSRGQS